MYRTDRVRIAAACMTAAVLLSGCGTEKSSYSNREQTGYDKKETEEAYAPQYYSVNLQELWASANIDGKEVEVLAGNWTDGKEEILYPGDSATSYKEEDKVTVTAKNCGQYLSISISSDTKKDNEYSVKTVCSDSYYLPLGEGKHVSAENSVWNEYLTEREFFAPEQLSMPFFAAEMGDYGAVVVLEDFCHTYLSFSESNQEGKKKLQTSLRHEYPSISDRREFRFRIYLTENSPEAAAKCYRAYAKEQGKFVTLKEKAETNPEVMKLPGAPFIYLWGDFVISPDDINWQEYRKAAGSEAMNRIQFMAGSTETAEEFAAVSEELKNQDYVSQYQKQVICRTLSELLRKAGPSDGAQGCPPAEQIRKNKEKLAHSLPSVFSDPKGWMEEETCGIIEEMAELGIARAWIGLNSWEQAYAKPELVQTALNQGYLIGSYDSYHSIHEPLKEQWNTAAFSDLSLYEEASVTDKNGNKVKGFQNTGRKLNPVFSLPAVKDRMKTVVEDNNLPFNSWFIDCDATGEIYDDYTPGHITVQEEDIQARLDRMAWIRDMYNMTVGSEGGNDFAVPVIAFAHGIELPSFSWMDSDMKENRESPYYIGNYYNPSGGVVPHFSKRIALKEKYYTLFADPAFDIPLYRLVYNECIVTAPHWDWSTFKIKGATADRMLRDILYNTAPLYHLDREEWDEYKEDIVRHTAVWSAFAAEASVREMTDFQWLTDNGLVQQTAYGEDMKVTVNFSDDVFENSEYRIPPHSAVIEKGGEIIRYTPRPKHA